MHNTAGNSTQPGTGAMYLGFSGLAYVGESVSSSVYMRNSTFDSNIGAAGAVFLDKPRCALLSNTSFLSNQGGALSALVIQGGSACQFGANWVFGSGDDDRPPSFFPLAPSNIAFSLIRVGQTACGVIERCIPGVNSAPRERTYSLFAIDLRNMTFTSNTGRAAAGILLSNHQKDVAVSYTTFHNNSAMESHGAISMSGISSLVVKSCTFTSNSALAGGAIYFESLSREVGIIDCLFNSNMAGYAGGAIAMSTSSLNITGSSFRHNSAGSFGGGAIICEDCSQVSVVLPNIKAQLMSYPSLLWAPFSPQPARTLPCMLWVVSMVLVSNSFAAALSAGNC